MLEYQIKDKQQRPWNFEVRVLIENLEIITVVFPKEPSKEFLKREVERRVKNFEEQMNQPEPEPEKLYSAEEINSILREKGIFKEDEDFEDIVEGVRI